MATRIFKYTRSYFNVVYRLIVKFHNLLIAFYELAKYFGVSPIRETINESTKQCLNSYDSLLSEDHHANVILGFWLSWFGFTYEI